MSQGSNENLGFISRMSELELKLKQSEDERLTLEDKFNQLLRVRKSEEEMHLYLLRENYSQLLRQDKMRCDRNDTILQSLANVESRASMLTAKTDRLRLLRQHYESYVSRHYPVLKKTVGRHRSVESLISDTNENQFQRSLSSSPRLMTSHSSSPFLRSPSLSRRNSLVVSNSEIQDPISYKVPNKINLTPHFSRRRLFESSPKLDVSLDSKTVPKSISPSRYEQNYNLFNSNIPTLVVSKVDEPHAGLPQPTHPDNERTTNGLSLQIPSHNDYIERSFLKDSSEFTTRGSEKTFTRISQPLRSNSSKKYDKLSPTRISVSMFSSKPPPTKPLTKSSSFSIGSGYSKNVSNYFSPERQRSSFIRRPSFLYQTAVSSQSFNRFQPSLTSDYSSQLPFERTKSSLSDRSSFSEIPSIRERSKSPLSERAKSPLSERGKSSPIIKSKSPLTVVDDIFKKYLINYDRRYLSDPVSESKYGKYLYPLGHYADPYSEDHRRNKLSNLLESKYDIRAPYYDDDISISSRESVGTNLYKTYGSHDSLFTNDHQTLFHDRNMSYDDKKDWKEWNHYRNRYEYPPTLGVERPQTKPTYVNDSYYPITSGNSSKEATKSASYDFSDDFPIKYSHYLNSHNERNDYDPSEIHLEKSDRSKDSILPTEKISGKPDLTFKDTFKIPQTPKKVSFSNEFLYDDKSDTEVSSNVDEVTTPFDNLESSKITEAIKAPSFEKINFQVPSQDINLSRENEPNESRHYDSKLGIEDTKKQLAYKTLNIEGKALAKEKSLISDDKTLTNSKEIGDSDKFSSILVGNNSTAKSMAVKEEADHFMESQDVSNQYLPNTENNIDKNLKETISNYNYSLDDDKGEDLRGNKEQVLLENTNDIVREHIIEKQVDENNEKSTTVLTNSSPVKSKPEELISSLPGLNTGLRIENETSTVGEAEMQSAQKNIEPDKEKVHTEKDSMIDSFIKQDSTPYNYGSIENSQKEKLADFAAYDTTKAEQVAGYNEEQVVYDQGPHEQIGTYDDSNTYKNSDVPEYPNDYNTEQYDQDQNQYDQYGPQQDGFVSEEYVQNDAPRFEQTEDVYGPKEYQQPEVYTDGQYEQQQHIDYEGEGYSQQNMQDYPQPIPQDQYEQPYKEGDQSQYPVEHYSSENIPRDYIAEQPYEGEYPPDYPQQQYDPKYQDPAQVPQNVPEQYKEGYDTPYQDDSQYGYEQVGSTYDEQAGQPYDEQYEQHRPQYEQQQQPPYDQYEQQPPEHYDDQYQGAADQYQGAADHYQGAPDQYQGAPDQYQGAPDQYQGAADQYQGAADQYQGAADQYQGAPDQYKGDADQYQGAADQYEGAPDQYQGAPDQYQGAADQYQGAPDQYQGVADQYQGAADQYQGAPDQYGNYNYTYDQTAPVTEQTYIGDEQQNYVDDTQPYDYNKPLQQPYDDVVQHQPYSENVPYDETKQVYPDEQNVYRDGQQVYDTSDYAPQNLDVSQQEKLPSDYDYTMPTHNSQPDNSQLLSHQGEPLYEPEAVPYAEAVPSSRMAVASEPAPKINQIFESDPESSVAQGAVTQEDSSDFDFSSTSKK